MDWEEFPASRPGVKTGNTQYIPDSGWRGASQRNFKARVLNRKWTYVRMTYKIDNYGYLANPT